MKNLTLSANYNFLNTTKTLLVLVLFSINLGIKAQQDCSDCPTANCIGSSHASYAAAQAVQDAWSPTTSGTFCMEFTPEVSGPVTRYSYHTITASSSGIIGAVISSSETPASCSSIRTYSLYATSGDCLGSTSPENLVSTNANGSGFGNPEWNGLISGQNYIMKVQYDVIAGCSMRDQCVTVYSSTVSAGDCNTCAGVTPACQVNLVNVDNITDARNDLRDANTSSAGLSPLGITFTDGGSEVYCVPVTVPIGATITGFKQSRENNFCGEAGVTYELRPVDCSAAITPDRTNAQPVGSLFNPEWDNLAAGDYVLCYTGNVAGCTGFDLSAIGYYNVAPAAPCVISQTNTITDDCSSPTTFDVQFTITFANDPGGNLIIRDTDAGNDEYTIATAGITSPHVFTVTLTKGNGTTNYEAYFSADNTCSTVFTITEPNCSCAAGAGTFSN